MISSAWALVAPLIQSGDVTPLPAESPIGGPLWSLLVPAMLLATACLGTLLLYRHFARRED